EQILNFYFDERDTQNLKLSIDLLEPFLKWLELPAEQFYLKGFIEKIYAAQKYLKENPSHIPGHLEWMAMIEKREENAPKQYERVEEYYHVHQETEEQVKYYVKEYLDHYNKVGLIWGLSTLTNSNVFGHAPLSERSPIGMGVVDTKDFYGRSLLSESVFYQKPLYQYDASLESLTQPAEFLATHIDVITLPEMHHVFFGNTLRLEEEEDGKKRVGYLTVGTHGGLVLGSLSRATHQQGLFISDNKIIVVTNEEGKEIQDPKWYEIPVEQLLSSSSGTVAVGGEDYFFLHIVPYRKLDVHFFIFKPKDEEYALVNSLREGAIEIVNQISMQMRIASVAGLLFVLVLLNNISKRITRPITHLANVTKEVAAGNLEAIQIPEESKKKSRDEVYTLYHSFFEMIQGLKEKERVRGILNKVVSEEIAEEALKGNIQLGGEEKKVTVLFADIRGLSKMTEKMQPQEVISLINTCMTKMSEKIDLHGGVIDKYVGDEVMALFGAPIEKPGSAFQAIQSAIDMIDEIKTWNQERKQQGLPEIEMGIGIHTGNVVAGNMGAENRLNYTVLGANVNLAARICSEAGGMQVLISESTLEAEGVKTQIDFETLEPMQFKGFTEPIPVFSVTSYRSSQ
ncbi:MAG: adenylate/guanylate cyclase domain-containing protein, partial [Chlamydiia bacterium]|nr:adenylate/guanylate cyclase domain-containing protein [Chlamydiia bacterium]